MSQTQEELRSSTQTLSRSTVASAKAVTENVSIVSEASSVDIHGIADNVPRTGLPEISASSLTAERLPIPDIEEANALPFWYRAVEILVAAIALLALAIPMAIISFIVRRGTSGPALFVQQRLGLGAEEFAFVKFRTMYVDARERFPELYRYQYSDDEVKKHFFKVNDDPRLTPQGKWLRRSTLDEIPNFIAVLTGKMSLVGPRPEIPEMLKYYRGDMLRKFSVRPGITGLAQTCGRGHLNFEDTVAYDIEYVENRSAWLNIKILFRTIRIVLNCHGAF